MRIQQRSTYVGLLLAVCLGITTSFAQGLVVDGDITAGDDIIAADDIESGYNIEAYYDVIAGYDVFAWEDVVAYEGIGCNGDMIVGGKLNAYGGIDPPYILYDRQSREDIIDRVKKEIPVEKMDGAVLFFNKDTKRLETYIPSEGTFYDLQGNLLHRLSAPQSPVTEYETTYFLDPVTGLVRTHQEAVKNKCKVRKGFEFDTKTGRFINKATDEEVAREYALEWCISNEKVYRDMQGNVLRSEPQDDEVLYVKEYRFDPHSGDVKIVKKAVHDRYALKEGYTIEKETGTYVNKKTGKAAKKEDAVKLIKAEEIVQKMKEKNNKQGK